jgi:dihydrofolate reductase
VNPILPRVIAVWAEAQNPAGETIMGTTLHTPSGLPWPTNREDLRHFRDTTRNHVLIMGSNTFDRLPAELKLPSSLAERPIIVLTNHQAKYAERIAYTEGIRVLPIRNTLEAKTLLENLEHLPAYEGKPVAVIGGASVIELFEPFYSEVVVTTIHGRFDGDVRAPSDEFLENWPIPVSSRLLDSATIEYLARAVPTEETDTNDGSR